MRAKRVILACLNSFFPATSRCMVSMTARNFRRIDDGRRRETSHGGARLGPQVSSTRNYTGRLRTPLSPEKLKNRPESAYPGTPFTSSFDLCTVNSIIWN